jgi:hypothetical protein
MQAMNTRDYTIGRGQLFFNKFITGTTTPTGERYLGNSPTLTVTSTYQDLPHYTSDFLVREMDDNFTLQTDRGGTFSIDNASIENIGLMFGSDPVAETATSATAQSETFTDVKLGYWYPLGVTTATPDGAGAVTTVVVTSGVTPVLEEDNYTVDLATGRVHLLFDALDITEGDDLTVSYNITGQDSLLVIEECEQVEGSLRFISANPKGTNKNYYWPYVRIQPTGDFAIKGEQWQVMSFNFAVLTPKDGRKRVYIRAI